MTDHPTLNTPGQLLEANRAVEQFVAEIQRGLDNGDADVYNHSFAGDVIWGGPYGATVQRLRRSTRDPSASARSTGRRAVALRNRPSQCTSARRCHRARPPSTGRR